MTQIGTVLAGKYEILKESGRGGMSVVYLAMDTHLNRNWAVKEVRKRGSGKNDEIVVNSLLAEANMVKRLDHPALPRIVDIIDTGETIYIVMDFIEGESLDKILSEYGAQPEEKVIDWAMQVCDVFSYLHSQKPPIIYRDMKPANLMLKPNGNISIIDFGIAREYKEQNLADTTVLGTKGYAPPEQYSGQTDPRSDIFALGMTMHHLLTGVDPRNGEPYAPVRQWNPELSEGIEAIINKCVEPAAENRYQSCAELLLDLQDPSKVTRGWRKKLKRRLFLFIATAALCVAAAVAGVVLKMTSVNINNQDYDLKAASSDPGDNYDAIEIYPERTDAYRQLIEYYRNSPDTSDKDLKKLGNRLESNIAALDINKPETAELFYDYGKLFFSELGGSFKARAAYAKAFFEKAAASDADYNRKPIANCYMSICDFMTNQTTTREHTYDDYVQLFGKINSAMDTPIGGSEANYDKLTLYYTVILLMNDQSRYMAAAGVDRFEVLGLMKDAKDSADSIASSLEYVQQLQQKLRNDYDAYVASVVSNYEAVEQLQNGGAS